MKGRVMFTCIVSTWTTFVTQYGHTLIAHAPDAVFGIQQQMSVLCVMLFQVCPVCHYELPGK